MSRYEPVPVKRKSLRKVLSVTFKLIRKGIFMIGFFLRQPLRMFANFFLAISLVGVVFSLFLFGDPGFAWNMGKVAIVMLVLPFVYDFFLGFIAVDD